MARIPKSARIYKNQIKELRSIKREAKQKIKDYGKKKGLTSAQLNELKDAEYTVKTVKTTVVDYNLSKRLSAGQRSAISRAYNRISPPPVNSNYHPIKKERGESIDDYWDRAAAIRKRFDPEAPAYQDGLYLDIPEEIEISINDESEDADFELDYTPHPGFDEKIITIDREAYNANPREYIKGLIDKYKPDAVSLLHSNHRSRGDARTRDKESDMEFVEWAEDYFDEFLDYCDYLAEKYGSNDAAVTGFICSYF